MKKANVMIACDNSLSRLGETICEKLSKEKNSEVNEIFYLTRDGKNIEEIVEKIYLDRDIDIFINLSAFLESKEVKRLKPCKHLFVTGFILLEDANEQEAFEMGFKKLKKSRDNLLLVKFDGEEKENYLLIYPEKTFEKFFSLESAAESLVRAILKRENVSHAQSIQESENAEVPEEVCLKFYNLGKILFERGFLPVVEGGTYGNFSLIHEGRMYITGRGADKGNLPRHQICKINKVVGVQNLEPLPSVYAKIYYSGATKPSIDTAINYAVMKETGRQATVHIHIDKIFAGHPMTGYNYPCGAKEELVEIIDAIKRNPKAEIVQQYKHGLIVMGNDFQECLAKIEMLLAEEVSVRKIKEGEKEEKEFREWEEHYKKNTKGKNVDLDIHDLDNLYVVQKGEAKVGLLYLKIKEETLYFVFYSLEEFTRKKLGLGEKVIDLVSKMAKSQGLKKIGVLTTRECNVIPYYEKKGFEIACENQGSIWMEKEIQL